MTKTFDVGGMHCQNCVNSVTNAISALDGVSDVKVSLEEKAAHVVFDESKVSEQSIMNAIEDIGFDALGVH
jgi:copper chaperone